MTSLFRLLDLGVEPFMIASALSGVLGQRLVRLLCDACKEPYKPKPEWLKKANIPADKVEVLYRRPENPEQVCPQCGGTGYFGRTGIYELMIINEPMRDMIRENPSINKIKVEARKNGMIYLQEDGLRLGHPGSDFDRRAAPRRQMMSRLAASSGESLLATLIHDPIFHSDQ